MASKRDKEKPKRWSSTVAPMTTEYCLQQMWREYGTPASSVNTGNQEIRQDSSTKTHNRQKQSSVSFFNRFSRPVAKGRSKIDDLDHLRQSLTITPLAQGSKKENARTSGHRAENIERNLKEDVLSSNKDNMYGMMTKHAHNCQRDSGGYNSASYFPLTQQSTETNIRGVAKIGIGQVQPHGERNINSQRIINVKEANPHDLKIPKIFSKCAPRDDYRHLEKTDFGENNNHLKSYDQVNEMLENKNMSANSLFPDDDVDSQCVECERQSEKSDTSDMLMVLDMVVDAIKEMLMQFPEKEIRESHHGHGQNINLKKCTNISIDLGTDTSELNESLQRIFQKLEDIREKTCQEIQEIKHDLCKLREEGNYNFERIMEILKSDTSSKRGSSACSFNLGSDPGQCDV